MLFVILMMTLIFWINCYELIHKLRKAFPNNSLRNAKLSKTQLPKIGQSGELLGRLLGPLLKTRLKKNVLKTLAKSALIPLGLATAASATAAAVHKKCLHPAQ